MLVLRLQVWKRRELAGKVLRLIQDRLSDAEFDKNAANLSNQFAASADYRFEFEKSRQLLIRTHNEALSVVVMRVRYPQLFAVRSLELRRGPTTHGWRSAYQVRFMTPVQQGLTASGAGSFFTAGAWMSHS
jgi:hypothetical protein